nr:YbaK/EbsC family protein [Nocardioides convexus]
MSAEHPSITRFRAEHQARGGEGEIVILPDTVHTAALAAEALGCEVGAIANSLLFDADGSPVLILTSGAHRVDTARAGTTIGRGPLRRATPDFVREHTGQVIGGVSPIGHPAPVPTYVDPWLARHEVVWAGAGHPAAVFSTTYDEFAGPHRRHAHRGRLMRVVVVGGGLGGAATAARLAKQGHEVALLEASDRIGGALAPVEQDGYRWEGGPVGTLVPAALRDLFRKTGRPLEAESGTDLEPLEVLREHRFADRTSVRLPGGSRADQVAAFDEPRQGPRRDLGQARRHLRPGVGHPAPALRGGARRAGRPPFPAQGAWTRLFAIRETLFKRLRHDFRDERLALVAGHHATAEGHDLRNVPSWVGVWSYLEQTFGGWRVPGGMARIAEFAGTAPGDPQGHRAHRPRGRRRGPPRGPCGVRAHERGRRRRRCGRGGGRPAPPAHPGAVRRADDAGHPAGGRAPGARGRRTSADARDRLQRRAHDRGPPGHLRPRRRRGLDPARARQDRRGHGRRAGPPRHRRPRPGSSPGWTSARATSWSTGTARRWGCCGRAAARSAPGWVRAPRSPTCTSPARTAHPVRACPSWPSRQRWWRG